MHDLLIRNGRVIDGAGSPWYWADVAVKDNQIVAVGRLDGAAAKTTLDAEGRFVSPGFIDMHTHSDLHPLANPAYESKIFQGVTTDVIGHDGLGLAPVTPETPRHLAGSSSWHGMDCRI